MRPSEGVRQDRAFYERGLVTLVSQSTIGREFMVTNSWKNRVLKAVFDRYMSWRLQDLVHPEYPVILEYPIHPEPRYGEGKPAHPDIASLLGQNDEAYRSTLAVLSEFSENLSQITETGKAATPGEPRWDNTFFSALDAIDPLWFPRLHKTIASRRSRFRKFHQVCPTCSARSCAQHSNNICGS